jgi:hypothetical protein
VHQVATILDNNEQFDGNNGRERLEQLLQRMEQNKEQAGNLASGIEHFLKVTRSYRDDYLGNLKPPRFSRGIQATHGAEAPC